jgi:hypothetical protein
MQRLPDILVFFCGMGVIATTCWGLRSAIYAPLAALLKEALGEGNLFAFWSSFSDWILFLIPLGMGLAHFPNSADYFLEFVEIILPGAQGILAALLALGVEVLALRKFFRQA